MKLIKVHNKTPITSGIIHLKIWIHILQYHILYIHKDITRLWKWIYFHQIIYIILDFKHNNSGNQQKNQYVEFPLSFLELEYVNFNPFLVPIFTGFGVIILNFKFLGFNVSIS